MKNQVQQENLILQKIKKKMDRIKATQQKLLQPIEEPPSHQRGKFLLNLQNLKITFKQNNNKLVFFIIYKIFAIFSCFLLIWFRKCLFFFH